jgi:addiction module RelE/StbE family toxin
MAGYRVDISEPAENDLRDIARYISAQLDAPMTAIKMIDALDEAIGGLANMPQKYPSIADDRLAAMGYRKLIVKNYIVFFTVDEKRKTVDVVRVLYARRDWLRIL